jgi:hypothetical protein
VREIVGVAQTGTATSLSLSLSTLKLDTSITRLSGLVPSTPLDDVITSMVQQALALQSS